MMSLSQPRSDCEEIVRRLWPHLDGALAEDERARVIAHLEGCAGCRSHYDFAAAFLEAVHEAAPAAEEFDRLRQRVVLALAQAQARS